MLFQPIRVLLTCITCLVFSTNFSQGCSDAGFCTMGAMRPDQHFGNKTKIRLKSFEISQYMGISRFQDVINSTTAEFNILFNKNWNGQIKLPFYYMQGPLGSNKGLSDISISATRNVLRRQWGEINFSIGAKIPTNNGNAERGEGRSLPMYYQTSLGTYDFISGISISTPKWLFATGYQQVIKNINENQFFWGPWKELGLFEESQVYHSSIGLERGKDIMLRAERNFRFSKFNFYLGLLDVWRLNKDHVNHPTLGTPITVENEEGTSNGHAVTFLWGGGYNFSTKSAIKILVGHRLIKRHFNPDGLSRELVISSGYQFKF